MHWSRSGQLVTNLKGEVKMGKKKKKKRSFFIYKLLLIILILVFLTGVLVACFPGLLFGAGSGFPGALDEHYPESDSNSILQRYSTETVNIALLGFDRSAARDKQYSIYRPDTILIAAINFRSGQVSLVNIPRDSYVKIHGTETGDKINHSYMHGYYRAGEDEDPHESGLKTTLLTIMDFLGGVPLHGYVVLDMDGAEAIVDSIGGIYYDVDVEVRCDFGRGRLLVDEGYQLLDGRQFMDYVRNRAGFQGGERGRTERQQKITLAFFDQMRQVENIPKIPRLYRAVSANAETELNLAQVIALGFFGLRINLEESETEVFSGSGQLSDRGGQNIWYLVIDEEERVNIIEKIFGVAVEKRSQMTLPGPVNIETEKPDPEPVPEEIDEEAEEPAGEEPINEEEPEEVQEEEPKEDEPKEDEPKEEEAEPEEEHKDPKDPQDPEDFEDPDQPEEPDETEETEEPGEPEATEGI